MNRLVPRLVFPVLVATALLLPVLLRGDGARAQQPAGVPPQSLAVLIVSDGKTYAQRLKEEQIIALIHKSLDEQGLPREVMPILTYHTNRADEKTYCEQTLGIRGKDLVFLGLAQHKNHVVKKVILREPNVTNPEKAVADLFQRAVAVLTGSTPVPTPTKSTEPGWSENPTSTPGYTPSPSTGRTRILTAVLCRSVNAAGEPLERTTSFSPGDTFYVSCEVKGLRYGTVLEARWYNGGTLIKNGRLVSDRVGDYHAWFSMSPVSQWLNGSYRVTLYVDGQQQATEYFRVNDRE